MFPYNFNQMTRKMQNCISHINSLANLSRNIYVTNVPQFFHISLFSNCSHNRVGFCNIKNRFCNKVNIISINVRLNAWLFLYQATGGVYTC